MSDDHKPVSAMSDDRVIVSGEGLYMEVDVGPAMRCVLDALELVADIHELIPDWCSRERTELEARHRRLVDMVERTLEVTRR
ncbi:MAG TPA: hypothetical protein VH518_04170 [Tepidisphaeraceae bacterium]|jgi:hypothetical protein